MSTSPPGNPRSGAAFSSRLRLMALDVLLNDKEYTIALNSLVTAGKVHSALTTTLMGTALGVLVEPHRLHNSTVVTLKKTLRANTFIRLAGYSTNRLWLIVTDESQAKFLQDLIEAVRDEQPHLTAAATAKP